VIAQPGCAADLVVTGTPIHTFSPNGDVVDALAIADGVVVAAGSVAEVDAVASADATRLAAQGAVLPGFCDTHMHFEKIAHELRMLHLTQATSVDAVLELVAAASRESDPGEWIQSFGDDNAWHEDQLDEKRLPTRSELDDAAPEHPVFLYRGGDAAALNSSAAEVLREPLAADAGWDSDRGYLNSPLAQILQQGLPIGGDPLATLQQASQELLGFGVTTIVDPGLPGRFDDTWQLYRRARSESRVTQRLYLMDRLDHRCDFEAELKRITTAETTRNLACDGVTGWGLKLLVDGEFANAWMGDGEPQPRPATKRYTPAQIEAALRFCGDRGWPICFHVMGRGAAEAVIDAVERVGGAAVFRRNQVTLAHGFLMSEQNIEDAVRLGIGISVQPLLAYVFEKEMLAAWGELAHNANPYRLMLDRGATVAGGSDVLPCEPLRGAAVAVTRTSRLGSRLGIEQALTPIEAVSLFTERGGPYVLDSRLGTLQPGAPADFVCWTHDPLVVPVEEWPSLRPAFTAVGGNIAWQNPSAAAPSATWKGVPA
jgi:predicted amidohydrolase YtcJ